MPEFYPVTMYFWDGRAIVCGSSVHKDALGKGWCTSLAAAQQLHDMELKAAEEAEKPKRGNAVRSASN